MIKIILTALAVSVFTAAITIGILSSNKKIEPTLTEYRARVNILSTETSLELRKRSIEFLGEEKAQDIIEKFEIWKKNNR